MKDIEINRKKKYYRLFEILPGFFTWATFALAVIFSIYYPVFIASLIIVYALVWLVRAFIMSARLVVAYKEFKRDVVIDWNKKCLQKFPDRLNKIYHLAILATYKEEIDTVRHSIRAIAETNYSLDKIIFVLAIEERDKENARKIANALKQEFLGKFKKFIITEHPQDIIGEVKGKGGNITYAAKESLKFISEAKIPTENVIVTTLDADNRVHKEYFACLSYKYLSAENPIHKSFQPLTMYFNNIWRVPIFIRSIAVGGSFWQMIESTRPYRMRNFSAHAQSLEALIATDFWSTKTIVEDGHQFWRSYFAFSGDHQVVPISLPIYQDAVLSPRGYAATFSEQYIQKRRWAWGCSDIPYVLTNVISNKNLPFWDKWLQTFRLIEGHFSWSTTSIVLVLLGWLPRFINHDFGQTVLAYNFPVIYSRILTLSTFGLVVTLLISTLLLPSKNNQKNNPSVILEWLISPVMLPIANIIFGSIAAIDAQTRLMFGKYLGFKVTEKAPYYD